MTAALLPFGKCPRDWRVKIFNENKIELGYNSSRAIKYNTLQDQRKKFSGQPPPPKKKPETKFFTTSFSLEQLNSTYTVSQKNDPTLKRYSLKLYGSILMIFGRNIQNTLEQTLHVSVFT